MKTLARTAARLAGLLCAAATAQAAPVFSTGSYDGGFNSYSISSTYTVSNAFTLGGAAHLTDFSFDMVLGTGMALPVSFSWSIGTSFFGQEVASGATPAASSSLLLTGNPYSVMRIDVDFADLDLAAGTYYLTLHTATAPNGWAFWSESAAGPSPLARQRSGAQDLGSVARGAFTFNGTPGPLAVPEPGALALASLGLLAAGAARRTRRVV